MSSHFEEEDIKNLFPGDIEFAPEKKPEEAPKPFSLKKTPPPLWKIMTKFAGLFIAIFIFSYALVNFNAFITQFGYFYNTKTQRTTYKQALAVPTPLSTFDPTTAAKIIIPKIGIEAPITWNVEEPQIAEKLLEGIVHASGTAVPGKRGNIFLIGHSSYYSWSGSPYKDVFALLEKVTPGDKIYIQYSGHTFTYQITNTKVVSPEEVSVMDQTSAYNLTLMTCVPVGTNLNRLIVTAEQIS